ncbi:MAG: hypothetical protein JRJ56_08025 [Deltaproteobacteria bacterium]|nr:hypothetical protein [Deltaproteobacteria bacterium]
MKMKRLMFTATLMLFLALPALAMQPADGMNGAQAGKAGKMNGCRMSAAKNAEMQAAMARMQAVRRQLQDAKDPATRKQLLQQHLQAMEACLQTMPAAGQMPCRQMMAKHQGGNGAMMGGCQKMAGGKMAAASGKDNMSGGCSCRRLMAEMMTNMKVQLEMMSR